MPRQNDLLRARSETEDGQRAVAQVVLNRFRHPAYPNSVCGVVYQARTFAPAASSLTCDGSLATAPSAPPGTRPRIAAEDSVRRVYGPVGTRHPLSHHRDPALLASALPSAVVGAHVFYRWARPPGPARGSHSVTRPPSPAAWPRRDRQRQRSNRFRSVAAYARGGRERRPRWHSAALRGSDSPRIGCAACSSTPPNAAAPPKSP
jgi:hypothetical protein